MLLTRITEGMYRIQISSGKISTKLPTKIIRNLV